MAAPAAYSCSDARRKRPPAPSPPRCRGSGAGHRAVHIVQRPRTPGPNVRHAESALGAVRAFRPPAASSLCVLTQPRPSTQPAGASSGESRVVLHAHATQGHGRVSPEVALPAVSLVGCRPPSYQIVGCVLPILLPAVLWPSWWGHGGRPSGPVHSCLFVVSPGHPHLAPAHHCISMGTSVGSPARQK